MKNTVLISDLMGLGLGLVATSETDADRSCSCIKSSTSSSSFFLFILPIKTQVVLGMYNCKDFEALTKLVPEVCKHTSDLMIDQFALKPTEGPAIRVS